MFRVGVHVSSAVRAAWIAGGCGIVAAIIGVIHWWPPSPPPSAPSAIQIEGRVIDIATNALIKDARVILEAGRYSQSQVTDTEGRYGFDVSLPETTEATFIIEVQGYPRYSVNSTLKKLSEAEDNKLLHDAVNPPAPPSNSNPTGGNTSAGADPKLHELVDNAGAQKVVGAVAAHQSNVVQPPAQVAASAQVLKLPPYVRRPDFVKLEATERAK